MFDRAIFGLEGIKPIMAAVVALTIARALAVVGQAVGLAQAIVGVWQGNALEAQASWIALFFCCFVARQAILAVQDRMLDRYAYKQADSLRDSLLQAVFEAGPALVGRRGSAVVVNSAIEGTEHVAVYIALIIPKMTAVAIVPLVLLIAMIPLDLVSAFIALVCFPFIILYMIMIGYTAKDDAAKRHGEFERMSNHFIDSLRGIDTLKAFGRSREHADRIFAVSERFREATMKTLRIATLSSAVLDTFATLALAAVAIMMGFRLVEGTLSFLPALTVLIMVPEYFRPIREFASDYHASLDGRTSFTAIQSIIEDARTLRSQAETNDPPLPPENLASPAVAFENISFDYDGYSALNDISFSVEGPCKVGIIGASGSGKTTLLNLLSGFADPRSGSVRICTTPLSTLHHPQWHAHATFIPQDPYIFHASLRDNVAFYHPHATDEEVARALEAVGLDALVHELPQGIGTPIGAGERMLSGGQAQRVALARAFLDPSRTVLLFDEPTAHLDVETELELKGHMLPLMENKLVFFATHRLHWAADMDYVIVMDRGRIAWQGTPDVLKESDAWTRLSAEGGLR